MEDPPRSRSAVGRGRDGIERESIYQDKRQTGVAILFTARAGSALSVMLRMWRFDDDAEVAIGPSEGPNIHAFIARALTVALIDVDGDGVIDLAALERRLGQSPQSVGHITQQASHRALRQPAADIARLCAVYGVPMWIDAAQTLGTVPSRRAAQLCTPRAASGSPAHGASGSSPSPSHGVHA